MEKDRNKFRYRFHNLSSTKHFRSILAFKKWLLFYDVYTTPSDSARDTWEYRQLPSPDDPLRQKKLSIYHLSLFLLKDHLLKIYTLPEHKSEYRSVDTLYSRNGLLFEREKRWSSLSCVFLSEVTTVTTSSWILFFLCRLGWHNYLSTSHWIHTFDDICDGSMKAAPGDGYLIHRISISHYKRRNSLRKHSLISFSLRLSSITSLISLFIANWVIQNGFSSR